MRKTASAVVVLALAISGLAGASTASAATEFGNTCVGNESFEGGLGFISTGHDAADPLPVVAPTSGVITQWRLNLSAPGITPAEEAEAKAVGGQQLVVFQPSGPGLFTVVGKSETSGAVNFNGVSSFPARIPVQQGDLVGLDGSFTVFCETEDPTEMLTAFEGTPPIGSTALLIPEAERTLVGVPVVAKIEPDVDGDGFGDETQDMCPQSAAFQGPCPVVTIGSLPTVQKKAVVLHVATNIAAPISVTATVDLGKGGKMAQLTAAPQTVTPGSLARFELPLTKWALRVRKELSRSKSLKVSITASAANVTGAASTSTATAHLRGEAKPVRRHKKKPAGSHKKK